MIWYKKQKRAFKCILCDLCTGGDRINQDRPTRGKRAKLRSTYVDRILMICKYFIFRRKINVTCEYSIVFGCSTVGNIKKKIPSLKTTWKIIVNDLQPYIAINLVGAPALYFNLLMFIMTCVLCIYSKNPANQNRTWTKYPIHFRFSMPLHFVTRNGCGEKSFK